MSFKSIYRYKFYLDANHFVTFDGKEGAIHPHTWEIAIEVENNKGGFLLFSTIEDTLKESLSGYQNVLLNNVEPFKSTNPTLENIGDFFTDIIDDNMKKIDYTLLRFEISETPSRSYITKY